MPTISIDQIIADNEALADWLKQAGLPGTASELRGLLAGIAAAPPSHPDDAWLALLPGGLSAETEATLGELVDRLRERPQPHARENLGRLRNEMAQRRLDGFIVPRGDEHPGFFIPPAAERLHWLSGFTGSAGVAVVLRERAALFTDGRYMLQAGREIDTVAFDLRHMVREPASEWFADTVGEGDWIGFDPTLVTARRAAELGKEIGAQGGVLVAVEDNPIDTLWTNRPPRPLSPVVPHDIAFTGRNSRDKRREISEFLKKKSLDAFVLTQAESIAWLLNIRGQDVPNTPLALGYATTHANGLVELYMDGRKFTEAARRHLGDQITPHPPSALEGDLKNLGRAGKRVGLDPASANAWIKARLVESGATVVETGDPCVLPRARKTAAEIEGSRAVHRRDGRVVTRFLCWVASEAAARPLGEFEAAERITQLRAEDGYFRGTSFHPIVGAGANGAIIHYRPTKAESGTIQQGSLLLVDSGGQYLDGTTDITRTVAIGKPTDEHRHVFTLVLKGHIAIAIARFPEGTKGRQLDVLARQFLWRDGRDFDHGTGHGVGSYLGVHEGPQGISSVAAAAFEPGMIVSNEPGYYKDGAFGIRIENLVLVKKCEDDDLERPMLEFETLSLAPIDRTLVDLALMTAEEIAWLDAYHQRVLDAHADTLEGDERAWLEEATAPLG